MPYIFKGSFDQANRTSGKSYRGPGMAEGLKILQEIRQKIGVPVLTDVHEDTPMKEVAAVVDVIQTPAFLCRQTNFIRAAASQGKPLNIKKGQFLSPWEMRNVVEKAASTGNRQILVCERGFSFGYNNLVVDMRGLMLMREAGLAVCFDATHSVQLPSAGNAETAGERKFVGLLSRAAAAAGIDALFTEIHEDPDKALCDGPCSLTLPMFQDVLNDVLAIRRVLKHQA